MFLLSLGWAVTGLPVIAWEENLPLYHMTLLEGLDHKVSPELATLSDNNMEGSIHCQLSDTPVR